jgi:hypothetical protein
VFGGVYLENIRSANFTHLARADMLLHPGKEQPEIRDFDFDGAEDICLRTDTILALISPWRGGEVLHWELRDVPWNLTHVVARRPEAYHQGLTAAEETALHSIHDSVQVKDPEALRHLGMYDHGMRVAAQDTVLPPGSSRDDYGAGRLALDPRITHWETNAERVDIDLELSTLSYHKRITVNDTLSVGYRGSGEGRLFVEFNLSLPWKAWGEPTEFVFAPGEVHINAGLFRLHAKHNAADAWREQVFSVSNTEGGVELAPQGWAIVFMTDVTDGALALDIQWGADR